MKIHVLDLFSCVGGHMLGLQAAGPFIPICFCEVDEWRAAVIRKHWPGVPLIPNIKDLSGTKGVDLIVGGPPCQGTVAIAAVHGRRDGRTLWPEMLRVVKECLIAGSVPWVVVEQPASAPPAWFASIEGGLERTGFSTFRLELTAFGLGAPHIRRRVFTLAHPYNSRLEVARRSAASEAERIARGTVDGNPWRKAFPRGLRVADGVPGGVDRRQRISAIGDSNPPLMMTVIGRAIMKAARR